MNREELVESLKTIPKIRTCVECPWWDDCEQTDPIEGLKDLFPEMLCKWEADLIADHLISLGLGTAEDLKLPENPYLPCDGDDRLLHGQVEGFEQAVACFESLNKKAWNPIDEPGGNQQSSRSTSENSSVNIPGEIKEPSRGK